MAKTSRTSQPSATSKPVAQLPNNEQQTTPTYNRDGEAWTKEDEQALRKYYRKHGSIYLSEMLGRSPSAIRNQAYKMKISKRDTSPWSTFEVRYLEKNYPKRPAKAIARTLSRTELAVRGKLHLMGLTGPASEEWTEKETAFIRKHYGTMKCIDIATALGRTADSVSLKAKRLGIRERRDLYIPEGENLEYLIENFGKIPYTTLAQQVGTSVHIVMKIAAEHGFRARPTSRPWTPEDEALLRKLYGTMSRREVAAKLDRNWSGVAMRATQLGLTKQFTRTEARKWIKREDNRLRTLAGTMTKREIAEKLGRTEASVAGRMAALKKN